MPVLTNEQIEKLAKIIRQHATWLTWRIFGTRYVSEADLSSLKAQGLLPMDTQVDAIKYAFVLGKLEALLKEAEWKGLGWDDLISAAEATHTDVENLQIQASELSAHTVLRGLEDDIRDGLYESLATATQRAIDESHVKEIVKDEVKVGVEMSGNFRKVARELAEKTGEYKRNWHRVAVTEMHAARQNGTVAAILNKVDVYEHAEGEDSQVSVVPDPDACADCRRLYLGRAGNPRVFKLSELLGNSGSNYVRPWRSNAKPVVPPLHPNSIAAYAAVEGDTLAATKMLYAGEIREIVTAHGRTLPVTPNHPVATTRGFIPACQVHKGDYLLSYDGRIKSGDVPGLSLPSSESVFFSPDNRQYRPTSIEEVFHSLSLVNMPFSVRRSGREFHGDAAYGDGDIDIVYVDGKLGNSVEPTIQDQVQRLLFESAKLSALAISHKRFGNSLAMRNRILLPTSIASLFPESFRTFNLPSKTCRIGSTSYLDTVLLEMGSQFASRDASFCRNLVKRLPSLVSQDKVIDIRDRSYSGHVYDLQTISGVIVTEGLIVSNCFCRIRYIPGGWGWEKGEMVLQQPEKVVERARAQMSKIGKSVEILKANPHRLLQESKQVTMPSEQDIANSPTSDSIDEILDKILALQKIHRTDAEIWERLDDLELKAIRRAYDLERQPEVPNE
jgi:hypothetical protein